MKLKLVTAPATLPFTVAEVKQHLRVDINDDDAYIVSLINAAMAFVDGPSGLGLCLVSQVWEMACDGFSDRIKIPIYPVSSVDSITYLDSDGAEQTLASTVYRVNNYGNMPFVALEYNQSWPTYREIENTVKVRFTAGYTEVPTDLKQALLLLIGNWYENREASVLGASAIELPFAVGAIFNKYRVAGIA